MMIDHRSGKDKTYECILCGRLYVHKTSASRHMKSCKSTRKKRPICLNPFGNENISYMFKDLNALSRFLYKCIRLREEGIWLLMSKKHFSIVEPKNNNIRFIMCDGPQLEIWDGMQWGISSDQEKTLGSITMSLRDIFVYLRPHHFIEEDELFIDYLRRFIRFVAKPLKWPDIPEWKNIIMKYRSSYVFADEERDKDEVDAELESQKKIIHNIILNHLQSYAT
jgi:hypothetical protein